MNDERVHRLAVIAIEEVRWRVVNGGMDDDGEGGASVDADLRLFFRRNIAFGGSRDVGVDWNRDCNERDDR